MKIRHPEKVNNPISPIRKKPTWIRTKILDTQNYFSTKEIILLSFIYSDYQKFGYKLANLKFLEKAKCFMRIFSLFSFEKFVFKNSNLSNFYSIKYLIYRMLYFILIFLKLDYIFKNKHVT